MDLQRRLQLGPGPPARRRSPEKGGCSAGVETLAVEGEHLGRSRGGLTSKIHLAVDGRGLPMACLVGPGQGGDNPQLLALLDDVSVARVGPGRPRRRPVRVLADKAYSHPSTRTALRARGISFTCPERRDQITHRKTKGSRGGRPRGFHQPTYAGRNVVDERTAPSLLPKQRERRSFVRRVLRAGYRPSSPSKAPPSRRSLIVVEEARGVGAVDDPVVVGQAQVGRRADRDDVAARVVR